MRRSDEAPRHLGQLLEHAGNKRNVRAMRKRVTGAQVMAELQMVCALRAGTQERWRRLFQEVAGSRRAQFEAFCRQAGITAVRVWLVPLPRSELLVVTVNTQEPQQTLEALATCEGPFAHWLREQVQALLGWNVQEVLPVPRGDLLLAWG